MKRFFLIGIVSMVSCLCYPQIDSVKVILTGGYPTLRLKAQIERNISALLNKTIETHSKQEELLNVRGLAISTSGIKNIQDRWESTRFYCTASIIKEELIKISTGYQLRNITVKIEDNDDEMDMIIDLNSIGMITDAYFGLNQHQYKNIIEGNQVKDKTREKIIINFMDIIRNAYISKDTDLLDSLYSDKALIIVGRTLKTTDKKVPLLNIKEEAFYAPDINVEYKRVSKKDYINGLKRNFNNTKEVKLIFKNIKVGQHPKESLKNFYGVQLEQYWKTDHYSDEGYVFFVIEFRENDHPIIWVRTWQDIRATDFYERIGFEDLKIK